MRDLHKFLAKILDSITEHIVVIDSSGKILYVNNSWAKFGNSNACIIDDWSGINYLSACDKAALMGDDFSIAASKGIRKVIAGQSQSFSFEYPCHSLDDKRWFMMSITPFQLDGEHYFVISHQNITERKLAEEEVSRLARLDGLTQIPNRRTFEEFLHQEWRRCSRLQKPLSLALIDLDHFKLLNDTYGHPAGDDCLIRIAQLLEEFANRPGDICARYGGEEFAIVWAESTFDQAKLLANKLLAKIATLKIENQHAPTENYLTASIGVVTTIPCGTDDRSEFVAEADAMLYRAKKRGRNRVIGMACERHMHSRLAI